MRYGSLARHLHGYALAQLAHLMLANRKDRADERLFAGQRIELGQDVERVFMKAAGCMRIP
jgi:hypothetical protein